MSKVTLRDLCKSNEIGKYGIPASAEDFDSNKVRYLRISDIDDNGNLLHDDLKSVTSDDIEKYILQEGDLVVARTGNSTGRTYYHENKNGRLAFAGFLIKYGLDPEKVNPKYLKYYTISKEYKQWVNNLSVGSTRGNINAQTFAECPIRLPTPKQQNDLVNILSALDAKIELNNRINAQLEAMAKTLYDYWFVQFDFPYSPPLEGCLQDGAVKAKPYKSSGGKMVYNEELKREIPEGWEVKTFGSYAKSKGGFAFKSEWWQDTGIPVIKIKDIQEDYTLDLNGISYVDSSKLDIAKAYEAKAGDVVIAMTGATVGKYAVVPIHNKPILVNQRVALFDLGNEPINSLPFLINSLNQKYFRDTVFTLASGAAQPNISNTQIDTIPLVMPRKELITEYNSKMVSTYKIILNNQSENQQLAQLRDWLLPMLMNGQVTVNTNTTVLNMAAEDAVGYGK